MTNHAWRYHAAGVNLGNGWRGTNYDDLGWLSSRGVFAFENDNPLVLEQTNTVLPITRAGVSDITTYYFRTHFTLTNDPYLMQVIITNLIDDGAVYYVNGFEVARQNLPQSPTIITYFSFPSREIEAGYNTIVVPPGPLTLGDNQLAVEVHNVPTGPAPRDVVFGLAASVVEPTTPTILMITSQPSDLTVREWSPVTFSVGVSGFPITNLQWYLNGTAIPGANRMTYSFTNASPQHEGNYTVRMANSLGEVISLPAHLSVLTDTNGPQILRADGTVTVSNVVITFSERLLNFSATNLNNYQVVHVGSASNLSIDRVVLSSNGSNVTVTTGTPLDPDENYILRVVNMADNTPRTNVSPSLAFPISRTMELLNEYSFFYFYNPFVTQESIAPGDDNPDLGTAWRHPDYVINEHTNTFWANNAWAPGAFHLGSAWWLESKGTELSSSMAPIVYFRAPVYFPGSPLGSELTLQYIMQDGGMVYWNGDEVYRANMPAGEVSWNTRAAFLSPVPASWLGFYPIVTTLKYGWNTLCAELHSFLVPQTNMAFALRLKATAGSWAKGPVVITRQPIGQTVVEGNTVHLSFMAAGSAYFQWFQDGAPILGATNAICTIPAVPLSMDGAQFSVLAWNDESSVMSSNAVLTVQQDFSPFFVRSAYAISGDQILISFSKPVDPGSATKIRNYQLTNGIGADAIVLSAIVTNGTNVLLQVIPGSGNKPHVLLVNDVRDATYVGHAVPPNSAVTVGLNLLFPVVSSWKYEASGGDLGTNWRSVAYSDSGWAEGQALLYNENAGLPAPKNTLLPLTTTAGTNITTYYFRKNFVLPTGATNAVVTLRHIIDDGVVFYMNNREFHRFNMAAGTVQWNTFANGSVDNANFVGPFNSSVTNLTGGDQVLAAEVHAASSSSLDVCFGAEVRITAPSVVFPIPNVPRLAVSRRAGSTQLGWTNTGFILQRAATLNGTNTVWEDILDSRSPYTVTGAEGAGFYRLKR